MLGVLLSCAPLACGSQPDAGAVACPSGTRSNPERATCSAIRDVRSGFSAQAPARLPDLAAKRAERRATWKAALNGPVPGGIGTGVTYNNGQLQVVSSSSFYTHMTVYPSGVGQLSDFLFTTATNRTEKSLEVVGIYNGNGSGNIGVYDWSCSATSPCSDGSTGASWQLSRPISELPCNYSPQNDGGNHKHLAVYYENSSELVTGTWTNAAYLWNYCHNAWDLIYRHQFTGSQHDCSSDGSCGWWGPIFETFQPDPQPDISELAFWGSTLVHDGIRSDLSPSETGWSNPAPNWSLFHRTANSAYGAGGHVVNLNQPPSVATAASAAPNPTTGTTTSVSVLGADDDGEQNLTYAFTATGPAPVTFSPNATNSAKVATATFSRSGVYTIVATIQDSYGATATSSVTVNVAQRLSSIVVTPSSSQVEIGKTQSFAAAGIDQFGVPMAIPATFTWAAGGGGAIDSGGTFTATAAGGPFPITASGGAVTGQAAVTVINDGPTVATAASATPNPVVGTTTTLSVLGADDGGEASLTYTWAATGPGAVAFSRNGDNAAKSTVASLAMPGSYRFSVTVSDTNGGRATSTVTVTAMAATVIAPASATVEPGGTQSFQVTGGSGAGYAWSVSDNRSGASITPAGNYTAGSQGGVTDTIQATDSLGNVAHATVTVASTSASGTTGTAAAKSGGGGCSSVGVPGLDATAAAASLLAVSRMRRRPRRRRAALGANIRPTPAESRQA